MIDARDRILHYALKLVHQDQPPVDQTAEIRAAWERGVRGSGIPEEGPDEELLEQREPVRAAPHTLAVPTWLVAASVLAAGGLAVWVLGSRGMPAHGGELATVPALKTNTPPEYGGPAVFALATDEDRARFAKAFEAATDKLYDWAPQRPAAGSPGEVAGPVDELARLLSEQPALWSELEARTLRLIELAPELPLVASRLVDLAAYDPSEEALGVARDLWLRAPGVFTEEHLVTLAERGAFEFEREVVAQVALYGPDSPEEPILAATYLAFQGDEAAVILLLAHLPEQGQMVAPRDLAAAVALDFQGRPEAWSRLERLVARNVEDALERGDLDTARSIVLGFEFFHLARDEGEVMELGSLAVRTARYCAERRDDLLDPEDIRALLEAM